MPLGPSPWLFWLSAFHMADAMRDFKLYDPNDDLLLARSTRVGRICFGRPTGSFTVGLQTKPTTHPSSSEPHGYITATAFLPAQFRQLICLKRPCQVLNIRCWS
ncbi:uncharacterized protein F4812DRAFT_101297 [Daldinia caldariorum]|uniref:uncharacterized protein n=1 Tax=Daldinia caldariorum TaxID=326644 RepID=UPI00200822F7|nr:uncharacterized protein F4812DRAFT_101297 [Daldinia caldariorum]KAI1466258.1 hypothetical protein F4812DRAFT_101297 [Daldinia caldariorum]